MLCENNWMRLSWGDRRERKNKENFEVSISSQLKSIPSFQQACDEVAVEIANKYDNLFVAMSGGCDSEHVANVFFRNKIPFTPMFVTYKKTVHNDQRYERWYANLWCRKHNVKPLEVDVSEYINSSLDRQRYIKFRPRLGLGFLTQSCLIDIVNKHQGHIVTGMQLEYYPDQDQMTYLEPQLGNYQGFVMQESDGYMDLLAPNQHPWAFFYWSPKLLASFVNSWNLDLNMQENKAEIYDVSPRPKMLYPADFYPEKITKMHHGLASKWGTRDCALLGTKQELLKKLISNH